MNTQLTKTLRGPLLAAAATLLAASAAHADSGKLVLRGYIDSPDAVTGVMLASHDYEGMIDRLSPHSAAFAADEVASSTNLCVAYAAMHRVLEAREACDEAVKLAKADRSGVTLADLKAHEDAVSTALSNQAAVSKLVE